MKLTEALIKKATIEIMPSEQENGEIIFVPNPNLSKDDPRYTIHDSDNPGFRLIVSTSKKKFEVQKRVGAKVVKFSLGFHPTIDLKTAVARYIRVMADMSEGIDPNIKRKQMIAKHEQTVREQNQNLAEIYKAYIEYIARNRRVTTLRDVEFHVRYMEKHPIWRMPFREIKPEDFESLVRPIFESGKVATAHKIKSYVKSAWNLAANHYDYEGRNPVVRWQTNKFYTAPQVRRRESFLDKESDEGKEWLKYVINQRRTGKIYRRVLADYLILTLIYGTRKGELIRLHSVDDINWKDRWIRCTDTKNGDDLYLPLTPLVQRLIEKRLEDNNNIPWFKKQKGYWVFPGRKTHSHIADPRSIFADANKNTDNIHIMPHDLRRTFAGDFLELTNSDSIAVKTAMNHRMATSSSFNNDMTLYYIQVKQRLRILRPSFEQREVEIFKLLGLFEELSPEGYVEPQTIAQQPKTTEEMLEELEKQNQDNPALLAMLNEMKSLMPQQTH